MLMKKPIEDVQVNVLKARGACIPCFFQKVFIGRINELLKLRFLDNKWTEFCLGPKLCGRNNDVLVAQGRTYC